ncbi:hypothetical protein HAX54_043992 [Datura stramonium]|uniref:Uncharacterized protein n=1 Tax=Datura stramonium TaxID=4076 RepID=A0ABS8SP24_DATST|nr:hypothetical protein [Datura stramonium]
MENYASSSDQYSSHRGVAMVLALVSAVVLSPLYVDRGKKESSYYETRWSCGGIVLPVLLAGLIVAIRSTSSSSVQGRSRCTIFGSPEPSLCLRWSSSWGLAGILYKSLNLLDYIKTRSCLSACYSRERSPAIAIRNLEIIISLEQNIMEMRIQGYCEHRVTVETLYLGEEKIIKRSTPQPNYCIGSSGRVGILTGSWFNLGLSSSYWKSMGCPSGLPAALSLDP